MLDAKLGVCSAEFTVKDATGAPVYLALVHVQVRYGPLNVKRMDLEVGTNVAGKARIKGLPERTVIWKHAFKNAALPVVTFAALLFVALLNGSIIVETVFGWPGLGLLVIEAVDSRDYPIVQAVVMCLSAMYIGVNLLVDVLYAYLNPKIRYSA